MRGVMTMAGKTVNATVKMVDGMQLMGRADSGHPVIIDADLQVGGKDQGPRPMELVLMALGSCTSMDVISLLKKMRESLTGLEVTLSGKRAEEDPMVYTHVSVHYLLKGKGLSKDACKKVIDLSQEKYCSVLGMVSKTAKVEYDWEITEE
jgi:putative redox protein